MDKDFNYRDRILTIDNVPYRLLRVIDKTATNLHHIMWKCNRQKYNTEIHENKVRISEREHDALNRFFKDKQNPRDQLLKVFNLVKPVLSAGVRQELEIILNCDDDLFYRPELLKKKWKKNWTNTNTKT
jgi:hypothetical protein